MVDTFTWRKQDDFERLTIAMSARQLCAYSALSNGSNMAGRCLSCRYRNISSVDGRNTCMNPLAISASKEHSTLTEGFFYSNDFDPKTLKYCDSYEEV